MGFKIDELGSSQHTINKVMNSLDGPSNMTIVADLSSLKELSKISDLLQDILNIMAMAELREFVKFSINSPAELDNSRQKPTNEAVGLYMRQVKALLKRYGI